MGEYDTGCQVKKYSGISVKCNYLVQGAAEGSKKEGDAT